MRLTWVEAVRGLMNNTSAISAFVRPSTSGRKTSAATFPEAPELRIALIDRPDEPSYGAGEPAICPVAAAIDTSVPTETAIPMTEHPRKTAEGI
jgi:hypothetical protein